MITKETIKDLFEHTRNLREERKVSFDIDAVCRWSYFFVDVDEEKLTQVGQFLEENGYEIIGFLEPDPEDEDQETIILRADLVERHTIDSLHQRNQEMYDTAEHFDITGYDGMDVGAVESQ